jgi:hypothetical protein
MILIVNRDFYSINQLIFVMEERVFFEVRTEFLNIIKNTFGLKVLINFWSSVTKNFLSEYPSCAEDIG